MHNQIFNVVNVYNCNENNQKSKKFKTIVKFFFVQHKKKV
jgi:hypothetical protein